MDYYDTEFKIGLETGWREKGIRNGRWLYQMALGILSDQPFLAMLLFFAGLFLISSSNYY
jgi:hypothetical protein